MFVVDCVASLSVSSNGERNARRKAPQNEAGSQKERERERERERWRERYLTKEKIQIQKCSISLNPQGMLLFYEVESVFFC